MLYQRKGKKDGVTTKFAFSNEKYCPLFCKKGNVNNMAQKVSNPINKK